MVQNGGVPGYFTPSPEEPDRGLCLVSVEAQQVRSLIFFGRGFYTEHKFCCHVYDDGQHYAAGLELCIMCALYRPMWRMQVNN